MGFLKSPEIPLEGLIKIPLERLIKIPLEGNFFRFPRESEKTRTRAVGFLKTPEIPLEGNFFRFPREAEKSRTKAVRFIKSTEIPLEGLIFHPLHVADWPRVYDAVSLLIFLFLTTDKICNLARLMPSVLKVPNEQVYRAAAVTWSILSKPRCCSDPSTLLSRTVKGKCGL